MGKTKRERHNRKFKYNVNRKKLGRQRRSTGKPADTVMTVKKAWEKKKSVRENLTDMGLAYDANEVLRIPTAKELLKPLLADNARTEGDKAPTEGNIPCPSKAHIAEQMEVDAKAPRNTSFQLPNGQIQFLTYCMDKYGYKYKAMARDNKNIYQETWKQIRNKIRLFQRSPSQWNAFIASRPHLQKSVEENSDSE